MKTPIVMHALPRWDGPYASTSCQMAKVLSQDRLVFYVDNPFTLKDRLKQNAQIKRRLKIWKGEAPPFLTPFPEFKNFIAISPPVIFPINALPSGLIYNAMRTFYEKAIWRVIDETLEHYQVEQFHYVNSFLPQFSHIHSTKQVVRKFYHCVDLIEGENYIARHGVKAEADFACVADATISTSRALQERMSRYNKHSCFVPNAADFSLFSKTTSTAIPEDLESIKGVKIIYSGNIGLRLDYAMIYEAATLEPTWNFVFIGPIDQAKFSGEKLYTLSNVHFLGSKPYEALPTYLSHADVCLIPFEKSELTKYIYPLKINEYLATGKPVVSTSFANLSDFESVIYQANSATELIKAVSNALSENSNEKIEARKKVAESNTWEERAKAFDAILDMPKAHFSKAVLNSTTL
ncbi:MAG: glycosyltransferase [Chloroherpetonaceae bacterium]|nr:glycosyltransferase [Chloroherpetonaceae bacterium]